ncbi:MAG: STN domain-containing protein [Bryobacteraceae bacterium]
MRARLVFGMMALAGIAARFPALSLRAQEPSSHAPPPAAADNRAADSRLDAKVSYGITQQSVQYVVVALGQEVGLRYNWKRSYRHTNPLCRRFLHNVVIEDEPFRQAIAEVLAPVGLRYRIENDEIVLYRQRRQK